ncbi:MAG: trypsin-like serine protease [Deltaproteobacteria bacterium]|nr:trypsin-like serine protease [Deltaproteobacteria bacterium]
MKRASTWTVLVLVSGLVYGEGCVSSPEQVASTQAQIVGGAETSAFPFVGALVERRRSCGEAPRIALCSVSLIAPDLVVTAGHCVAAYRDRQLEVL